jgi:hypothetical protein
MNGAATTRTAADSDRAAMPRAGDVVLDQVRSSADGACLADKLVSEAAASPAASWSWERRRTHVARCINLF